MDELKNGEQIDMEIKRLRRDIKKDYDIIKKGVVPQIAVPHLERIIRNYNKIYSMRKPILSDKMGFATLKIQYKTLCAIAHVKPQRFDDAEELKLEKPQ